MGKKIILLLIITSILGLIAFFLNQPFRNHYQDKPKAFFENLQKENITLIEIAFFLNGIRLEKDKDQWWVSNFETELQKKVVDQQEKTVKNNLADFKSLEKSPADPERIDELLESLLELKKKSLISSNPAKQGLLQITDAALNLTLYDDQKNKLGKIYIGKQGPTPFSNYVRLEDSQDVYLVDQPLYQMATGFYILPK